MKIDFKDEKNKKILKWLIKLLPFVCVAIFIITFVSLSFLALFPKDDENTISEGDKKVNSLNIKFNTNMINDLNSPVQAGTPAGGRNPFGN